MMDVGGIYMSPLQVLCGSGRHDIAEMHDRAEDLRNIPSWLEVWSFLEENFRGLKTDGNGEPSAPGSSPLSTHSNVPIFSAALVQTVSPHPNILFAYAGCFWYISYPDHMYHVPAPYFNTTVGVAGPWIQSPGSSGFTYSGWIVYEPTGYHFPVSYPGMPATSIPIWPHPTPNDPLGINSQGQDECLVGCPVHMSCFVFCKFLQMWGFTAVQVHRSSGCVQVAASLAREDAGSKSPVASCRAMTDSICYVAASNDGEEGIPPLPRAVPSVPSPAGCTRGEHEQSSLLNPNVRKADNYKDCSVKIYLASMEGRGGAKHFSDKNDKMHLNQMIELQLDVETLARRVAVTLAVLHWVVKIDAYGVQFSLHSTWKKMSGHELLSATGSMDDQLPDADIQSITKLRVEHFEEANFITMDERGVLQAVSAAQKSLYIPKPKQKLSIQKHMWDAFVTSYIGASDYLLRVQMESQWLRLPRLFIHHVIQEQEH